MKIKNTSIIKTFTFFINSIRLIERRRCAAIVEHIAQENARQGAAGMAEDLRTIAATLRCGADPFEVDVNNQISKYYRVVEAARNLCLSRDWDMDDQGDRYVKELVDAITELDKTI